MRTGITHRRLRRSLLVWALLAAIFLRARSIQQAKELRQRQPYGRYTADQMLARAEHLCCRFAPKINTLLMSTDRELAYTHDRTLLHIWEVVCEDTHGNDVADFRWNADTGELLGAFYMPASTVVSAPRLLSRTDAVNCARQWLEVLGCGSAGNWRPAETPRAGNGIWSVRLVSARQHMRVGIDASTGIFLYTEREAEDRLERLTPSWR